MTNTSAGHLVADEAPTHPEEIRSEFDLRVGKHITLQGWARITPAGLICSGLSSPWWRLPWATLPGRSPRGGDEPSDRLGPLPMPLHRFRRQVGEDVVIAVDDR